MLKISSFVGNSNNLYLYNEIERYKSMMNDRPLILITNDDGIQAKGIKELIFCLRAVGDIVVFAPDGPRSGMSSAITSVACKERGRPHAILLFGHSGRLCKAGSERSLGSETRPVGLWYKSWNQYGNLCSLFGYHGGRN